MDIRKMFSYNVFRIIIESYNLCNRRCYMCPQSLGIRGEKYIEFPYDLFEKLLKDLASIDYSNTIAFGRYHEPLMFADITLRRIKRVRELLPNAEILLNTNGDFLDYKIIQALSNNGLSSLKIMCYQDGIYSNIQAEKLCMAVANKFDLNIIEKKIQEDIIAKYIIEPIGAMKILIKSENYSVPMRGCNRGGLIKSISNYTRVLPCDVPLKNIDIDYNGDILPCNNLLSDALEHKPYIIGNLSDVSIFEAYERSLTSNFTKRIQQGDFSEDVICQQCSYFYNTKQKVSITI